jgi:hypothetical protein
MTTARIFFASDAAALERLFATATSLELSTERAAYLVAFLREGATTFVKNGAGIRIAVAVVGRAAIPLVINDGQSTGCYLLSPYVHYIAYLIEEVKKMRPRWKSLVVRGQLHAFGAVFRALQFDRVVSINNWLFTTSLTQSITAAEIAALAASLRHHFPDHALVYRGLDTRDEGLTRALAASGFAPHIHRPVLEWRPDEARSHNSRRRVQRDIRLTEGRPFTFETRAEASDAELARIAWMYETLYVGKHSTYNVHYTKRFFEIALATKINFVELVYAGDRLSAFVTVCRDGDRIISALAGYDPDVGSKKHSPYSAAIGCMFRRATLERKLLFLSTGVSLYKRRRGAREVMEHEAFDVGHLPPWRRAPWVVMKRFLEIATTYMSASDI